MPSVKFIHTADLHLDTPFKGLSVWNSELSRRLKDATFKSFKRIIDACIERKVDFLVISGDIFDSDNKSLAGHLRFIPELKRLADKGIPTYLVCGNHDPYNHWIKELKLPENVYCFDPEECGYKTFIKGGIPVADIYGMSFGESKITQNLADRYKLSPSPAPVSIAVLHGSVGEPGPHASYAPFTVNDVLDKGFDYWALGHIHKSRVIRDKTPVMIYPGNPQGRDFGETGKKGCYLVTINEGQQPSYEFIPTQIIRFEDVTIDITGVQQAEELDLKIRNACNSVHDHDGKTNMMLRIALTGRTALHSKLELPGEIEQLTELFNEGQLSGDSFVWIDSIELNTYPDIDPDELKKEPGFTSEVLKVFDRYFLNNESLDSLINSVEKDLVNPQARKNLNELSPEVKRSLLDRARTILIDELTREK
jgi:DNA repair exonuclease SbcCD nuclease subunit